MNNLSSILLVVFLSLKFSCVELKCVKKPIFLSDDCLCGDDGDAPPGLDVGRQVLPLGLIITRRGGGGKEMQRRRKEEGGCFLVSPQGTAGYCLKGEWSPLL